MLTINDQRSTLLLKVKEQTEKNKQEVYALKGQLAEKAREVEDLELVKAKMDIMTANMMSLMKYVASGRKESLDFIATDVEGVQLSEQDKRIALMQAAEAAKAKQKKIGKVTMLLNNVKIKTTATSGGIRNDQNHIIF